MKKTVLTFGLISGAMSASMMLITIPFADRIGWEKGEILGYTGIVLSALMVFFSARRAGAMGNAPEDHGSGLLNGFQALPVRFLKITSSRS